MAVLDLLRYGIFALFGVGSAFMVITNIIAFNVLRPPKRMGFLWWHVTAISVAFLCIGAIALDTIVHRIGEPATWRLPVGITGFALFCIAQIIIFNVERNRLSQKTALEQTIEAEE